MDFNTTQAKEGIEEIASMLSELVVGYAQEENVSIGEIEQGMRQMLQQVGQQAMGQVLEKSDLIEASIRCQCQHKANYRCRREGMVITVFGRVRYKRSYYICDHCGCGEKPLDTRLKNTARRGQSGFEAIIGLVGYPNVI